MDNNLDNTQDKQISLVNQGVFVKREVTNPLKDVAESDINYKNVELLAQFITIRGKIVSRSVSNITTRQQALITRAIKRARVVGLLSFVSNRTSVLS